MNNLNSILIEGTVVNKPVFDKTAHGMSIAAFELASCRCCKNGDGYEKVVSIFNIELLGKYAEAGQSKLAKNKEVRVAGRLAQECFSDKNGNKKAKIKIVAEHIDYVFIIKDEKILEH